MWGQGWKGDFPFKHSRIFVFGFECSFYCIGQGTCIGPVLCGPPISLEMEKSYPYLRGWPQQYGSAIMWADQILGLWTLFFFLLFFFSNNTLVAISKFHIAQNLIEIPPTHCMYLLPTIIIYAAFWPLVWVDVCISSLGNFMRNHVDLPEKHFICLIRLVVSICYCYKLI